MSQYFLTTCYQSASVTQIIPQRKTNLLIVFYHFVPLQFKILSAIGLYLYKLDKPSLSFFACYRFLYHCFVISFSSFKCVNSLTKLLKRRDLYLETDEYLFDYG